MKNQFRTMGKVAIVTDSTGAPGSAVARGIGDQSASSYMIDQALYVDGGLLASA